MYNDIKNCALPEAFLDAMIALRQGRIPKY